MPIFLIAIILAIISGPFVLVNFIAYLIKGRIITNKKLWVVIQIWTVAVLPLMFLSFMDLSQHNNCCSDSAIFSPEHRIGIYALIIIYTIAYTVSVFRKTILPPIPETILNSFLLLGLILNLLFCKHFTTTQEDSIWPIFGNIPILLLLLIMLTENQKRLQRYIQENQFTPTNIIERLFLSVLKLDPLFKYPCLILLLIPIIIILSLFLILFGQKPDSIIRAFTETYKHGFSQLDYMCDNVECGGHFLCSVGANGHKSIVMPVRYGERNGSKIICNRQLLVSNAFEELVLEKTPLIHKYIRHYYNKVGNLVHKHYHIFNNKIISDFVYLLMKPLEYLFLIVLYTLDKNPENRIATQYLNRSDKEKINDIQQRVVGSAGHLLE